MRDSSGISQLSVVIICCDDERVFKAISSVDVKLPIVVSLVPNSHLEQKIRTTGADVVLSERGNYSISCNRGLAAVKTDNAFIMDSDCVLHPGCLTRISDMLISAPLARAHVNFCSSKTVFASEVIAKWHSNISNQLPIKAYTPGLGIQTRIKPSIGNYFFDERIFWSCDSEFSHRVHRAGLEVGYSPDAILSHAPMTFTHFIKSGYKHGMGTRAQVKLGLRTPYENPDWIIRRLLFSLRSHQVRGGSPKKQNFIPSTVDIVWKLAFYWGYYSVFLKPVDQINA